MTAAKIRTDGVLLELLEFFQDVTLLATLLIQMDMRRSHVPIINSHIVEGHLFRLEHHADKVVELVVKIEHLLLEHVNSFVASTLSVVLIIILYGNPEPRRGPVHLLLELDEVF